MCSDEGGARGVVVAENLGKCYHLYARPADRLKQALFLHRRAFYKEFWAIRGASFTLARGEAVGIIGRNGAGKSTLLHLIAGTLTPTEGAVRVEGRVAALLELGSGFNPEFTGRENVYLNGSILGLSRAEVRERFDEIARFADIGDFIDQPLKTYSSGMGVRLAFAVQVLLSPDVLIVDEALAVGDAEFQRKCFRRLEEMRERGVSLLFVSHSNPIVRQLCSRAIYLERGRVKAVGPAGEVCDQYETDVLGERVRTAPVPGVAPGPSVAPAQAPPGPGGAAPPAPASARAGAGAAQAPPAAPVPEHVVSRFVLGGARQEVVGTRRLEVVRAEARVLGPRRMSVDEGGRAAIVAVLRAREPVPAFLFGFLIRTKVGASVFGASRGSADLGLSLPLEPDAEVEVRVEVEMAVQAGDYFVSLGLQTEGFGQVLFYVHDALNFRVDRPTWVDQRMVTGLARLPWTIRARRLAASSATSAVP